LCYVAAGRAEKEALNEMQMELESSPLLSKGVE